MKNKIAILILLSAITMWGIGNANDNGFGIVIDDEMLFGCDTDDPDCFSLMIDENVPPPGISPLCWCKCGDEWIIDVLENITDKQKKECEICGIAEVLYIGKLEDAFGGEPEESE